MAVTSDKPTPYAPTSVMTDLILRHRDKGLPAPVNAEVLTRAGVSDSLIPRTLQALQRLDLIDDDGRPTQLFEGLRKAPEAEFKPRLVEWLNSAYSDVIKYVDPANDDETAVRDAFRSYIPTGQQDRMVSLFIGLYAFAGVGAEKTVATRSAAKPRARTVSPAPAKTKKWNPTAREAAYANADMPPALAGLMASLPKGGDGWTKESRDKFVALFGATLDFSISIITQDDIDNRRDSEE